MKPESLISQGAVEPESQQQAIASQLTDQQAATEMPHADLDRVEALKLMDAVFGVQLEGPAGVFDGLHVENFLSDNVGAVSSAEELTSDGVEINGSENGSSYQGPALLESTVPLRTEAANGQTAVVNLGLEENEGELQSANPLVEVGIPQELGEGIQLPSSGVRIELEGAPAERGPSIIDQSVAAYPNVAQDTDLAVAPTPTGLETLTQIRTASAPLSQTFRLNLPDGASLQASPQGGAEVLESGETIVGILPPSAIGASGNAVPVQMEVTGNTFTLSVTPPENVSFPIMLDPIYESYSWYGASSSTGIGTDWISGKNTTNLIPQKIGFAQPGLEVATFGGTTINPNDQANWFYHVPRLATDQASGFGPPTSWISSMSIQTLMMSTGGGGPSDKSYSPYLVSGIWNEFSNVFDSVFTHGGSEPDLSGGWTFNFSSGSDHNAKAALGVALLSSGSHTMTSNREVYAGSVSLALGDEDRPNVGSVSGPTGWVGNVATAPIETTLVDSGLGVKAVTFEQENRTYSETLACTGTASTPCPRTKKFASSKFYDPSKMAQGYDYVKVSGEDVVGNKTASPGLALVKVDHSGPAVALSGSMTEQNIVGKNQTSYLLKTSATDGANGGASYGSSFGAAGAGSGQFSHPAGIAVDPKGNLWVVDENNRRIEKFSEAGVYQSSFGSSGTGNGQFGRPTDIAIAASGNLWVTDAGNSRLEEFNEKGEYITKVGTSGTGSLQFNAPESLAIDAKGNIWVGDTYNHRVQELNENGEFVRVFGAYGSAQGQIIESTGIAVGPGNNVWVADWGNNRIEEFGEGGTFIRQFGTEGTGNGQFSHPDVIEIDGKGNVLVGDQNNERIQEFNQSGEYSTQFGSAGSGSGQFAFGWPMGLATDAKGNIWVSDTGNNRVQKWTQQAGEPQSGVASSTIEIDGKAVDTSNPGCSQGNCAISRSWTLNSSEYSVGQHPVTVTATDAAGNKTTKTVMIKLGTAPPPIAVTEPAHSTTSTSTAFFGTVNPRGLDTTYYFQYGESEAYGFKTPAVEPDVGWGTSAVSVGANVTNLSPNTRYHFRIVATNESGTSYGADQTLLVDQAKPTMQFSSSYSSSSPTNYGLTITASDPGAFYSGVKSVTVLINGSTAATETLACPAAQCPATGTFTWAHSFDHPLNGSDRLTVLAVDDAGNATSTSFDLPSKVVHASVYTADPASGGIKVAEEWAQTGTHNSRRTTSADVITRGSGECQTASSTARCSILRSLNTGTENGEPQKYFSEVTAEMSEPTAISEAGTLLLPRQADFGQSIETGAMSTVLQSWQTPPSGAGGSFEKIVSSSKASEEDLLPGEWTFWVDSSTGLPVKAVTKEGTQTPHAVYYSYDATVQEAATLSPGFFMQPPPTRESEGCKASGTIGGWSFNKVGMVYPEPTFNSLVLGDHGLVTLHPEGAAIDGYEKRSELTSAGVTLSTNPADVGSITWEVTESASQILEQSGESVVIETEGGSPSAVITSSTPQRMSVVNGVEGKAGQSGDKIVLEGKGEAVASVQPIKNEPLGQKMPCITQGQIEHAVSVQEEAAKARNEAMGAKASGGTKTTSVVVFINPHPALSGVSVTDKYGACSSPHVKTFGTDGRVEFGGCPVGKDVTLTVPSSVGSGGTTYNVPDSSRTFQPPAAGWTVQFNYNAQAPPPPPPGEKPPWFTPLPNLTIEDSSGEAGASSEQPISIPPGIGCVGLASRPFKSDTQFPELFTAEAWLRLRCRPEAAVVAWSADQSLYRYNKNTTPNWMIRQHKEDRGPGPAVTNQGPYVIAAECRGLEELLSDPVKLWKHVTTLTTVSDNPPGTEYSAGEAKAKIHCG